MAFTGWPFGPFPVYGIDGSRRDHQPHSQLAIGHCRGCSIRTITWGHVCRPRSGSRRDHEFFHRASRGARSPDQTAPYHHCILRKMLGPSSGNFCVSVPSDPDLFVRSDQLRRQADQHVDSCLCSRDTPGNDPTNPCPHLRRELCELRNLAHRGFGTCDGGIAPSHSRNRTSILHLPFRETFARGDLNINSSPCPNPTTHCDLRPVSTPLRLMSRKDGMRPSIFVG